MIRRNTASFSVYSDTKSVREISAMLGVEPTRSGEKGDLTAAGRAGRDLAPERLRYQQTHWSLTLTHDEPGGEDQSGFSALRALLEIIYPSAHVVAKLREGGETRLWWSGDSDSSQGGGFVLGADVIARLAELGCDVFGTVYTADDEDDADGDLGEPHRNS